MSTTWISVKDRLPEEKGYYRVIRNDSISGRYKAQVFYSGVEYEWLLLQNDVLYWLEEPPMPEVAE